MVGIDFPARGVDSVIRFVRQLPLSNSEKSAILRLPAVSREFRRGDTIYDSVESGGIARILVAGLAVQYRMLPDGERQSADLVFPSRFCDLSCILFGKPDHFLAAVTDGEVLEIPTRDVLNLFSRFPRVPILLLHQEARDRSILFEHLLSVGRRSAVQRLAHLLTEIRVRSEMAGMAPARARRTSIGLQWFGDLLGLTSVHVSRCFRNLKELGLVKREGGQYVILDAEGLVRLAGFDAEYLHTSGVDPEEVKISAQARSA